jgi:hypothetical protein
MRRKNKRKLILHSRESLSSKQRAFLNFLEQLGYEYGKDVVIKPNDMSVLVSCASTVYKKYVPTFFVVPELTAYDVDSNYNDNFLNKARLSLETNGYELSIVTEEFPFDEYLTSSEGE